MTPQEQGMQIVDMFYNAIDANIKTTYEVKKDLADACALIAVKYIISANPHSNPFNTDGLSSMDFWMQVKQEIISL